MDKPRILTGALVGLLLTAPLIAVLYLAHELAGLPFVPFDLFDWAARVLPGPLVTAGIDVMVAGVRGLGLGDTAAAAKTAEQLLAVLGLLAAGVVAGAALFAILRRRPGRPGYLSGLALGALVGVAALVLGERVGGTATAGPVASGIWVVGVFLAWGAAFVAVYRRLVAPVPVPAGADERAFEVERIDRRRFLIRLGGATAAITVVGAGLGALAARRRERMMAALRGRPWSATHALPNAGAAVVPVSGTRLDLTPVERHYRIDINTRPPVVREDEWRLRIGGLVDRPLAWTLDELRGLPALHQFITLSCISNPVGGDLIGTTRWTGVSLRRVLDEAAPRPGASHLRIRSVDGYDEVVPTAAPRADQRIMLAYAWDGLPLPAEHGFPLRLYVPDVYGMKQPKWIESIEAIDGWEPGYWVRRGWDAEARVHATSVIDAVAPDMMVVEGVQRPVVSIGGIAFAGARGISGVDVSVDGAPWAQAALREPLSDTTWVVWRYDWPFEPGDHMFTVRCRDGDGALQVAERTPVRPDGATGLDGESVMM